MIPMIVNRSQRWRDRRDHYVPASSEIDPTTLAVDVIDCMKTAKPWIERSLLTDCSLSRRQYSTCYQRFRTDECGIGYPIRRICRHDDNAFESG